MSKILVAILISISLNSFGQQWIEYKIDSNLTVQIPDNFKITDTLGVRIIMAHIDNALIMIEKIPNTGEGATNIHDKKALIESYKGFEKGFLESQKGKPKDQEIKEKDGLHLSQFSYYATMGDEKQIRHCLAVFLNEHWYAVQFWEVAEMTDELIKEREQLFSSLKFPAGTSLKNKMSDAIEGSVEYRWAYFIGKIFGYILVLAPVILLIIWISRRAKRTRRNAQQQP